MIAPLLPGISLELIKRMVASHYRLAPEALNSPARNREISEAREALRAQLDARRAASKAGEPND